MLALLPDGEAASFRPKCGFEASRRAGPSAARDLRDVVGDRLRVVARLELRRHPAGAGAADLDRVLDALLAERADLVEVRPGDTLRTRGLERVAAPAALPEQALALVELGVARLVGERAALALRRVAVGEDQRGHGDSEAHVDDRYGDSEAAPAACEVGLARAARAAPEGDIGDRRAEREESDDEGCYRHAAGILVDCRDDRRCRLRRVGRLATGALPAPERGEDLTEAGQRLILRGALLVVDHQQPLRARSGLLGDPADRVAHLVGRDLDALVARVARLLGEHAGRRSAGAGLGFGGRTGAAGTDHELAMGAARGRGRPGARYVSLDKQEAMRAVRLSLLPCRGSIRLNHPCPFDANPTFYVPP